MVDKDVTELFSPVSDGDVVRMHGQMWRVRLRCPVRIEELTEPGGGNLAAANWRSSYAGGVGRATFADDVDDTGRSVVQVRGLAYPGACGLRATNDILRTSSGSLTQEGDLLTLTTRRTRYVFRRVAEEELCSNCECTLEDKK